MLALPGFFALQQLDPASKDALRSVLLALAVDARKRAEKCWRTHKAPMALYWKCVAVYAGHTARALRGNSVCPPLSEALVRANMADQCATDNREAA